MSQALQTVLAEMTLKDLASGNLAKIQKAVETDIKAMQKAEQQAGMLSKAFGKLGIGGTGPGAGGSAMGNLNERAQNVAQAIGSGSAFHNAISQIHVAGPYLSAALTAVEGAAQNFVAGVQLQKEQHIAAANAAVALNRSVKTTTNLLNDSYFTARDTQKSLTALRDVGVKAETIEKNKGAIGAFTKAQGLGSLEEGMAAIMSGNIKSGRGLTDVQINMIKAYAPLLRNTMTADIGMRNISRVLAKSEQPISQTGKSFQELTKGTVKTAATVQEMSEDLTVAKMPKGGKQILEIAQDVARVEANIQNFVARGAVNVAKDVSKVIKGGPKAAAALAVKYSTGIDFTGGRAGGGEVTSSGKYIVGENGPEVFQPNTSGRIIPRGNMRGGGIAITNNFYVQGGNPAQVERAVMAAMDKAAQTIWRQNSGLPGLG